MDACECARWRGERKIWRSARNVADSKTCREQKIKNVKNNKSTIVLEILFNILIYYYFLYYYKRHQWVAQYSMNNIGTQKKQSSEQNKLR